MMEEREPIPPLFLESWLDEHDRRFDRETDELLEAADRILESLRLEYERKARRYLGRPKRAA